MPNITYQYASDTPSPIEESAIAEILSLAVPEALYDHAILVRLVDEDESQTLNHQFRKKNKPTNVLSFPHDPIPGFDLKALGDIVMCMPVIVQEARAQEKSLEDHFTHMLLHGVLHLQGYDHQTDDEAEAMEKYEAELLHTLGIANPYE